MAPILWTQCGWSSPRPAQVFLHLGLAPSPTHFSGLVFQFMDSSVAQTSSKGGGRRRVRKQLSQLCLAMSHLCLCRSVECPWPWEGGTIGS